MDNTSVMDINSTFNSTSDVLDCFKQTHVGIIVDYFVTSLCVFVGTPAHSCLLWLLFHNGWKIKPTQVFPLNLIILELIYCSLCALAIINVLIFRSSMFQEVTDIVFSLSWAGRPLTQICICVEQYLAVLHPILFLKYKGVQYRIVLVAAVWLIAAAYAVYEALLLNYPDPITGLVFVLAMAVISFCCVSVLRALKLPRPGDTQITTERGRDVGNQLKRNAFNTIFTVLLIILFSYLPQVSVYFISVLKLDEELFNCDILPIINSFNVFGVIVTPLLKMYKDGHLKCFNYQGKLMDGWIMWFSITHIQHLIIKGDWLLKQSTQ